MKRKELLTAGSGVCLALVLVLISLGCARGPATMAPAEFFKTKTLDWTASGAPGANIDQSSRLMLPALARHLGTSGTVTSRTGGGGLEGHNYVWGAEPDGTHFDFWNTYGLVGNAIFEPDATRFELDKFSYIIGFPSTDRFMFYVARNGPYTSLEALKAGKNLKLGGTSPAGLYTLGTLSVVSLLDLDARVLAGFQGAAGIALAIAQGEIAGGVMDAGQGPLFKDNLKPLFALGTKRTAIFPDVQAIGEMVTFTDPAKKLTLATGDTFFSDLRAVFSGPGVPPDRLELLRSVFMEKVIPEVRADLEKAFGGAQRGVVFKLEDFVPGQEVTKRTKAQWEQKDQLKQIFESMIKKYRM